MLSAALLVFANTLLFTLRLSGGGSFPKPLSAAEEREWLEIGQDAMPILEVEQTGYLDDGRIFEYSTARHRADCFELHTVSIH